MQLVLNTRGLNIKVRGGLFRVTAEDQMRDISPEQVTSIAVTSPCSLTSSAVQLAARYNIPIYFFNRTGDAEACLRSPYFESLATLRRKQVYFSDGIHGSAWVVEQFKLKTEGQVRNLKMLGDRLSTKREQLKEVMQALEKHTLGLGKRFSQLPDPAWSSRMMGWEGHQAKLYWRIIGESLPVEWQFSSRSRRPAKDAYNSITNYFYGMLYAMTEQALFSAGLDPHLGILHADEYDRPTLAYDLIEPFRPWVDGFILHQILREDLSPTLVVENEGEYWIDNEAKKELIPAFQQWMNKTVRWNGKQMSRRAQMHRSAGDLARLIKDSVKRPGE